MKLFYFDSTYKLYEAYKNINTENPTEGYQIGYTTEGLNILRELDYLYKKIAFLTNYFVEKNKILTAQLQIYRIHCETNHIDFSEYLDKKRDVFPKIINYKKSNKAFFKTKLYTKLFYYRAFRLRNIIRYSAGLGETLECKGILKARHLLQEYSEKPGSIDMYIFELGMKKNGPILKTRNPENDEKFEDSDLFSDAFEFKTNLEKILADFNSKHD